MAIAPGNSSGAVHSTGKNALWLPDGSIYHLGAKKGEIHQRLIAVGDHKRADSLAELLDKDKPLFSKTSSRLFRIHSGTYKGVPVSIVGIGMGAPMMDFFVREASYVVDGPLAIIRLGSCGLANPTLEPGTIVVAAKGSIYCYKNYVYFDGPASSRYESCSKIPYCLTAPVKPNAELTELLLQSLKERNAPYYSGLNVAGETFYACQGRDDDVYEDENTHLLEEYVKLGVDSIEMETHQLMHLAKQAKIPILTSGCAVGIVQRVNATVTRNVEASTFNQNILTAGLACLDALSKIVLPK